jgi:hypothetical protein
MTARRTPVCVWALFLTVGTAWCGQAGALDKATKKERDRSLAAIEIEGKAARSTGRAVATPAPVVTRESLWKSFPADIREMVYRWDPSDSRNEKERQRALFDFIYEGFDSAAWIPESLFKRKERLAPFGDADAIITQTIGLVG